MTKKKEVKKAKPRISKSWVAKARDKIYTEYLDKAKVEDLRKEVLDRCLKATELSYPMAKEPKSKKPKPMDERAQKASDFLASNPFGCQNELVKRLTAILLDEPRIANKADLGRGIDLDKRTGVIVIPVRNTNSHNYPIGEPVFLVGRQPTTKPGTGLRLRHIPPDYGNNLTSSDVRRAKDEEITAIIKKATPATLMNMLILFNSEVK